MPVTSSNRRTPQNEYMDDVKVTPIQKIVQVQNKKLLEQLGEPLTNKL